MVQIAWDSVDFEQFKEIKIDWYSGLALLKRMFFFKQYCCLLSRNANVEIYKPKHFPDSCFFSEESSKENIWI
jgi:hypothetical protein